MSTRPRRANPGDGLFLVGLVGLPGSGKTTVARALERDGARVLDADALGHAVTHEDPEVRAALVSEYGASVYGPAGLDRARVAASVFRDPEARARLNRLVHPRILARLKQGLDALHAEGFRGVVVVDAALLLDWAFERECDAVVAVEAPDVQRIERLRRQRGWTPEEVERRTAAQRSPRSLREAADVVLDNTGNTDALEHAAREAIRRLRATPPDPKGSHPPTC